MSERKLSKLEIQQKISKTLKALILLVIFAPISGRRGSGADTDIGRPGSRLHLRA